MSFQTGSTQPGWWCAGSVSRRVQGVSSVRACDARARCWVTPLPLSFLLCPVLPMGKPPAWNGNGDVSCAWPDCVAPRGTVTGKTETRGSEGRGRGAARTAKPRAFGHAESGGTRAPGGGAGGGGGVRGGHRRSPSSPPCAGPSCCEPGAPACSRVFWRHSGTASRPPEGQGGPHGRPPPAAALLTRRRGGGASTKTSR